MTAPQNIKVPSVSFVSQTAPAPQAPAPVAPSAPASVEADVDALILGGVLSREVTPFKGWSVTMHTLTNAERLKASMGIPNSVLENASAAQEAAKVPTLLYAITKIEKNGHMGYYETPESKAGLQVLLENTPAIVIDVLYMEYLKLVNDLIVIVETGVKKN